MAHSTELNIQQAIDDSTLSRFHASLIILGFLTLLINGYGIAAMAYITPAVALEWGLAKQALGPVFGAALLGLSLGALIAGPISDWLGRKRVLIVACLFSGLSSLVAAYADSLNSLMLWRFLTGFGLGALLPNTITLISEYAPQRCRSRIINTIYCGFTLGAASGVPISSWLIPLHGWRSMLLLGGIAPLLLTLLLGLLLPESVKYLVNHGCSTAKIKQIAQRFVSQNISHITRFYLYEDKLTLSKSSIALLFSRPYLAGTLMLWLTCFMGMMTYHVLLNWMPLLMQGLGYQLQQSTILTLLFIAGGALGALFTGWLMDHWNAHKVVSSGFALSALLVVAVVTEDTYILLLGSFIFLIGFTINGSQAGLQTLSATFYPTHSRATGISWMQGMGHMGCLTGTIMATQLLAMEWQVQGMLMFLAIPALLAAIAILFKMVQSTRL